jgi:ATP-dependent Lon protease
LAAHRGGVKQVIIPHENEKDLVEIPDNVKADLQIHCVKWMDEVLQVALDRMPVPRVAGNEDTSPEITVEDESAPSISPH